MTENGWDEYKRYVVSRLEDHEKELDRMRVAVHDIRNSTMAISLDLARLHIKAGMWGALTGIVAAGVAALVQVLAH